MIFFTALWRHLSRRRHVQFFLLLALMGVTSLFEMVGIGAVLPFLAVLTSPNQVFAHPKAGPIIQFFGIVKADQLVLLLTIAFVLVALVAMSLRLLTVWASTRLSYVAGGDLSLKMYRLMLFQPYAAHVARNSSEAITLITHKANVLASFIMTVATIISATASLIAILVALIIIDPLISVAVFMSFGAVYALTIKLTRARLLLNSQVIARESTVVMKSLQEGLGGIRDILIDGRQAAYCEIYRQADHPMRRAFGSNAFINVGPRYVIEALGMLIVVVMAYSLIRQDDGIVSAIPVLGAFALGAQRLLPVLQQAYAAWSNIRGSQASLHEALDFLDQESPEYADETITEPLKDWRRIGLNKLGFRYRQDTPWVLQDIDLVIEKGSCVGFIGASGSGKSTLLDIIMGLLDPTKGTLTIDGVPIGRRNRRAWQALIAHIPQVIFLADATIEENIAFGVSAGEIDYERVRSVAKQAQIDEVIETWPYKYQTRVGERGIQLSGGQRQRIGIARALYKQAEVLIFDEATNALDAETEKAVMEAIEGLRADFTILIIAHRLSTLSGCNKIVELGGGGILRTGSFQEICAGQSSLKSL